MDSPHRGDCTAGQMDGVAVVYPCQLFLVHGCAVSRRYIHCYTFSVVNVYHDHLKFCGLCINGRMYDCCSECNVVSNECNEPIHWLAQLIGTHGGEVMYFRCVCFMGELGFMNCDDICMCVVNKQFEPLEVAVMRVLLFVLHVCLLRECAGDGNAGVGDGGGVVSEDM